MSKEWKASIVIISVIFVWAIIFIPTIIPGSHTSSTERTARTEEEMAAIRAAEEMDMASVLGIDRFSRFSVNDFRWSNVTDGETIEFYQDIIDGMDRSWDQDDAAFKYTAGCQHVDRVLLFPDPDEIQPGWYYFGVYSMESSNAMADFESHFRFMNFTSLPHLGEGYLLEDAYIIRQHLRFDYDLSYGYILDIEQLVILDGDCHLMVLMSDPEWQDIGECI